MAGLPLPLATGTIVSNQLLAALSLGLTLLLAHLPGHAAEDFVPVTDEMLQNPADGDWLMWRPSRGSNLFVFALPD